MPVPFKNNNGQVMYDIQCTNANNILYQPPQSHRIERKLKQSCHWRINVRIYILFKKKVLAFDFCQNVRILKIHTY